MENKETEIEIWNCNLGATIKTLHGHLATISYKTMKPSARVIIIDKEDGHPISCSPKMKVTVIEEGFSTDFMEEYMEEKNGQPNDKQNP